VHYLDQWPRLAIGSPWTESENQRADCIIERNASSACKARQLFVAVNQV
jgi:hypothetical protein